MARREGQRLAKTRALAADWVIKSAPGALFDLTSAAILRITETSFVDSDGMSIWPRLDSRDWALKAALAVPQGPSHHQRKDPGAAGAGDGFSFDGGSIFPPPSSLYPLAKRVDLIQSL